MSRRLLGKQHVTIECPACGREVEVLVEWDSGVGYFAVLDDEHEDRRGGDCAGLERDAADRVALVMSWPGDR